MPDTPSIVIVKAFNYRGKYEEFSNRYHFLGSTPSTDAQWEALATEFILLEQPTMPPSVTWVRAYGYKAGTEHSIAQIDYTVAPRTVIPGTFAPGTNVPTSGDVAATIRWPTTQLNSRGKRIYLRKYMHGVYTTSAKPDELATAQASKLQTFGQALVGGGLTNGRFYCGPQGAPAGNAEVSQWLTTRTLKRRGKRPLP